MPVSVVGLSDVLKSITLHLCATVQIWRLNRLTCNRFARGAIPAKPAWNVDTKKRPPTARHGKR
ncbi:hypothetical protein PSJ8397_00039 [Pseudooctadecabacter jejudonensis]|uniref:Uncharacterized protein n=1 Tax=Pseudooctadecabacter jejudonensis TaxID=1391910 RepID=A0A1Y5R769_9RHOB|nr:hypothetical protein PSJ8397_00039 [Pseudooctadecabacter jejudonensis]